MIRSQRHIAIFAVLWTCISIAMSYGICFYVVGLEYSRINVIAVFVCPLVIAPIVAIVTGQLMLKLHRLTEKLQFAVNHDALTTTWTRQYFFTQVQSLDPQTSAAFLMIDIDHFKDVNDNFGHFVGDVVIRETAHRIKANVRDTDILARFGGEEFIIMLPNTPEAIAQEIAERIRAAVARTPIRTTASKVPVTVSVGVGVLSEDGDAQAAMSTADQALYAAKQAGRNLVKSAA